MPRVNELEVYRVKKQLHIISSSQTVWFPIFMSSSHGMGKLKKIGGTYHCLFYFQFFISKVRNKKHIFADDESQ